MKAETMMKRINTQRKEIAKCVKEIRYYEKEYVANEKEHMKEIGRREIHYYTELIKKYEIKIAEMSKQAAELASEEERSQMVKDMAKHMEEVGFSKIGYTTNGLKYWISWNHGMTERSRHCYSMDIEGKGTVFTSGTLETVADYILNN